MPSFDVVSEVDMNEATNAIYQANKEIGTRFDFKGTNSKYEQSDDVVTLSAQEEFQIKQMIEILRLRLSKRGVDVGCLLVGNLEESGKGYRQSITLRQGLETVLCKKIVKTVKDLKLKVQGAIQGDHVRITGKKRDDLQTVMAELREIDFGMPLQFKNMRD